MSERRGGITLRQSVTLGPGPVTLEEIRQFVLGLVGQVQENAIGDAEIVSMMFSKLLGGTLAGEKALVMEGEGVILRSDNYVADLQRMHSGVINQASKTLYIPGGQFTAADIGREVFGETFTEGTEIESITDSEHAVLNNFPGVGAVSVLVYIPDRPLGAGWALKGDGTMEINVGGIFRGELQIQGFQARSDGTIEIGAGDSKLVALPDGSFSWGFGGTKIGITPDGTFFVGGESLEQAIFQVDSGGNFTLRNTGTSEHSINIGAIDTTMSPPAMSPSGGAFDTAVNVAMVTLTQGAAIYYTEDGSTPDTSKTLYTGPVPLTATTTIKAVAYKLGIYSAIVTRVFTEDGAVVATPEFSPVPGDYSPLGTQTVEISSLTPGASIRYTTNGDTPTDLVGTLISPANGATPPAGSVNLVTGTTTLKAIAFKSALANSAVMSGDYYVTHGGGSGGGGRGEV